MHHHPSRLALPLTLILVCACVLLATAPPARAVNLTAASEAELNTAINAVNSAGAGTHTITLTADIILTHALHDLSNAAATEIVLDGGGHTISGDPDDRILWIEADTTVRLRNVTLTGGGSSDVQIEVGGAILNLGTLTVENSRLTGNHASYQGGAIANFGALTIVGSTLSGNTADYGGAITTDTLMGPTTLTIRNSTLTDNEARVNGGTVLVGSSPTSPAEVTLNNVTLDANRSPNGTAGIDFIAGADSQMDIAIVNSRIVNNVGYRGGLGLITRGQAEMTITASTVADNRSTAQGGLTESSSGGIYVRANAGGAATVTLLNSTLSGNSTGRAGGGLLVVGDGGAAEAKLLFSTLADNTSTTGGGGIHTLTINDGSATVHLSATIVANGAGAGPDCAGPSGSILSDGYNLAGDGTCFLTQASDLPASATGLLPLALNAPGNTPTHALSANSPALNRIPAGSLGCGAAVAADQRGVARPQPAGGACDIGAYERAAVDAKYRLLLPVAIR